MAALRVWVCLTHCRDCGLVDNIAFDHIPGQVALDKVTRQIVLAEFSFTKGPSEESSFICDGLEFNDVDAIQFSRYKLHRTVSSIEIGHFHATCISASTGLSSRHISYMIVLFVKTMSMESLWAKLVIAVLSWIMVEKCAMEAEVS